ncbi:hypothetical protein DKM44_14910 [Deinococcus irradiatisoli]|uniref:DUF4382 domain-containing protein n=1 Tax=Deinococcus irradiatisoli TaxID=2202254 RepID=A0A2Z3JKE9_9DEIO|nr:hypothetical protein [Deinococcus irradiatisoli]AWN24356.1 hypothetical protein DKM44_14910 [Deinococcus irradiatisoli]
MKKFQVGLLLAGSLSLASCNAVIQKAADNTPVSVLPLAGKKMTGSLTATDETTLSLGAQAIYKVPFTLGPIPFGDFDPNSLPSALQNPKGLDIHLKFSNVTLACQTTADKLKMKISDVSLTVSDAAHGSATVSSKPNIILTLTKTANGYSVESNNILLKAVWSDFKAIVVKSGAETPNSATLSLIAKFDDGAVGCAATLDLASTVEQNIRY